MFAFLWPITQTNATSRRRTRGQPRRHASEDTDTTGPPAVSEAMRGASCRSPDRPAPRSVQHSSAGRSTSAPSNARGPVPNALATPLMHAPLPDRAPPNNPHSRLFASGKQRTPQHQEAHGAHNRPCGFAQTPRANSESVTSAHDPKQNTARAPQGCASIKSSAHMQTQHKEGCCLRSHESPQGPAAADKFRVGWACPPQCEDRHRHGPS